MPARQAHYARHRYVVDAFATAMGIVYIVCGRTLHRAGPVIALAFIV